MAEPVVIGEVLAGKYRLDRVIGEGGMGVVVAAEHLHLSQPVAIKLLRAESSREMVERFSREARAAARIQSEHVPRVMDVDFLESGEPYIVMELLEGRDLGRVSNEEGPLPLAVAVDYVLQACEAVAHAHRAGIVHRDLKPANLFLTSRKDGSTCIKVLDFGISKLRSETPTASGEQALTRTDAAMGSPTHMAPEQWVSAKNADERSDIWSLGAILYELIGGAPPFLGEGIAQICRAVLDAEPPSLQEQRAELPAGLEMVVLRCLEKLPEKRFPNVGELSLALAPFAPASARPRVERIAELYGSSMAASAGSASGLAHAPTVMSDAVPSSAVRQRPAASEAAVARAVVGAPSAPGAGPAAPVVEQPVAMAATLPSADGRAAPAPVESAVSSVAAAAPTGPAARGSRGRVVAVVAAVVVLLLLVAGLSLYGLRQLRQRHRQRAQREAATAVAPEQQQARSLMPTFEHAPAIVAAFEQQLPDGARVLELTLAHSTAELTVAVPKRPLQVGRLAWRDGRVEPRGRAKRQLGKRHRAFVMSKVELDVVPRIVRHAVEQHPDRGKVAFVKLRRLPKGLVWTVCLGPAADCKSVDYRANGKPW